MIGMEFVFVSVFRMLCFLDRANELFPSRTNWETMKISVHQLVECLEEEFTNGKYHTESCVAGKYSARVNVMKLDVAARNKNEKSNKNRQSEVFVGDANLGNCRSSSSKMLSLATPEEHKIMLEKTTKRILRSTSPMDGYDCRNMRI